MVCVIRVTKSPTCSTVNINHEVCMCVISESQVTTRMNYDAQIKIWLVALSFSCLIAYWFMLPGYAILGLLMWIVVILFTYLVVIPLRDGLYSPLIDQLKKLWLETFVYFLFEYWQNDPGTSFQFIKNINQFWSI